MPFRLKPDLELQLVFGIASLHFLKGGFLSFNRFCFVQKLNKLDVLVLKFP